MSYYTVNLTKTQCESFSKKYRHTDLFNVINGCLEEYYYTPLRIIQKTIAKQIVEQNGFQFNGKLFEINMDLVYEDENIKLIFSSWIPYLKVYINGSDEQLQNIPLKHLQIEESFNLYVS